MGSIEEARYLTAIFNSETLRRRIAPRQSRGQWGARDIHKLLVNQPIPRFAENDGLHRDLVELAEHAEQVAVDVPLPDGIYFVTARQQVRAALATDGVANAIDRLVERLVVPAT